MRHSHRKSQIQTQSSAFKSLKEEEEREEPKSRRKETWQEDERKMEDRGRWMEKGGSELERKRKSGSTGYRRKRVMEERERQTRRR